MKSRLGDVQSIRILKNSYEKMCVRGLFFVVETQVGQFSKKGEMVGLYYGNNG